VSPGRHELVLVNAEAGFRQSRVVQVDPGEVTAVNITSLGPDAVASPAAELPAAGEPLPGADVAPAPPQ
jgi:hypothetical protein